MCGGSGSNNERSRNALIPCCQSQLKKVHSCIKEYEVQQQPVEGRSICIADYEKHIYKSQSEDICDKGPREPYQIPGYAGHVPTLQFRSGGTYGDASHKALISRNGHRQNLNVTTSHICPSSIHEPYKISGYTGHVPGLKYMVGGTYVQNTHKLLYSIQPYPNREVNLSPYRSTQMVNNIGNGSHKRQMEDNWNGIQPNKKTHEHSHKSHNPKEVMQFEITPNTYERPKEHYYQPKFKYRTADTYATTADLTLVDSGINEDSKVMVSTRELDETQVVRIQSTGNLNIKVQATPSIHQPLRHRPMVPGFDVFIDNMRGARGQQFEFTHYSPEHVRLQQQLVLQKGRIRETQRRNDSTVDQYRHYQPHSQQSVGEFLSGCEKFGKRPLYTNSILCDFVSNYRPKQSSEWAPANISRPDPPAFDVPGEVYTQHTGMLPGYSAHVPGALFRCGKTFTDDSRDARKAIRQDRF